jgi:chromosome partitioning related protein ParA
MLTLTVVATKGGVGKTTLSATIGGLLSDMGYRVLLVDADVQPSLSRYFSIAHQAPHGLTEMVMSGVLSPECISHIELPPAKYQGDVSRLNVRGGFLHIVTSDTRDGRLQDWLSNRLDRLVRIRMALKNDRISESYDVALIDTQGAVGHLQDAAVNAADLLIAPASPDIVSAREFVDGTIKLLERHESSANMGYTVPAMKAIINRAENTVDSRTMANLIREQFMEMRGRVNVLNTVVPSAVAYRKAATLQVPVHWVDPVKAGDVMHQLLWELIPSLEGKFTPNHRGELPEPLSKTATHSHPTDATLSQS